MGICTEDTSSQRARSARSRSTRGFLCVIRDNLLTPPHRSQKRALERGSILFFALRDGKTHLQNREQKGSAMHNEITMTGYSNKNGTIPSRVIHGAHSWNGNVCRMYFMGVGYVTMEEMDAFKRIDWSLGTVFASHHTFVPLRQPFDGLLGWMWFGRDAVRRRVAYNGGHWIPVKDYYRIARTRPTT